MPGNAGRGWLCLKVSYSTPYPADFLELTAHPHLFDGRGFLPSPGVALLVTDLTLSFLLPSSQPLELFL